MIQSQNRSRAWSTTGTYRLTDTNIDLAGLDLVCDLKGSPSTSAVSPDLPVCHDLSLTCTTAVNPEEHCRFKVLIEVLNNVASCQSTGRCNV